MDLHELLSLAPTIRYVAINLGGEVGSVSRPGLADASSDDSDRYEELLVNPALINLAGNRGAIDCGGLRFVVVRYGAFFQIVQPVRGGHLSIAVEADGDPLAVAEAVRRRLRILGLELEGD